MIVPTSAKVGYRRDFSTGSESPQGDSGLFLCAFAGLLIATAAADNTAAAQPPTASQARRLLDSLPMQRTHRTLLAGARDRLKLDDPNSALPLLQAILDSPTDSFLLQNDTVSSARSLALQLIRTHPSAGTRRYGALYQRSAAALLRQAMTLEGTRRIVALRQVARRFRLTDAGFDALNQLATSWLDQGHPELAWRALRMMATEPAHRSRITVAIRSKITAASRLTGLPRPPLIDPGPITLEELTRVPRSDWPLPLGSARGDQPVDASAPLLAEAWHTRLSESTESSPLIPWSTAQWADGRLTGALALFPIVVDRQVIVRDQRGLRGLALDTGGTLWHYATPCTWQMRHRAFDRLVPILRSGTDRFAMALTGNPRFGMITSDGQRIYAVELSRTPEQLPAPRRPVRGRVAPEFSWPSRLVALPLSVRDRFGPRRSLSPAWTFPSSDPAGSEPASARGADPLSVLGAASPAGGMLLVLVEQRRQIDLAALSPGSGRLLWTQPLAHGDAGLGDVRGALRHSAACLPSTAAGLAICPTGTGITVSLNLVDGTLLWAHDARNPDHSNAPTRSRRTGLLRPPRGDSGLANLPLVTGNQVVLLSPFSERLASVDLETGRPAWSRGREGLEYVAAASGRTLLVVGPHQVEGIDLVTGNVSWQRRPGLVSGRGVRLGEARYLVPLKSGRITCLQIDTGREVGLSLPPSHAAETLPTPVGLPARARIRPGNLVVAGDWILSLTADRITAYPQARRQLARVQAELAADPENDRLRLQAAELTLALGQHDGSRRLLDSVVDSPDPTVAGRGRRVLRELLFQQLDSARSLPNSQAGVLLQRLGQLAETPRDSARVLVEEGRWHLEQNDPLLAFESASKLARLETPSGDLDVTGTTEITADRDGIHVLTRRSWVTALSRRSLRLARSRDAAADRTLVQQLQGQASRVAGSKSLDQQLAFVRRHADSPLADPVRLALAKRLIGTGRFQQAELLLLAVRQRGRPRQRLPATIALVELWSRLGLHEECGPLLDELATGRLANVSGIDTVTGGDWVESQPRDTLAIVTWKRHRHPTPRPGRVEITRDASISAASDLPATYQRFRRRFSTSERSTFDLLETYTGSTRRVTLMDRQVGIEAGHIDLPTQFSNPIWWHQSRSGHLLPLGSHSSMLGLSLLQRSETRPLWKRSYAPLKSRPEMLRVGPSGVLAVTFQSRQHLIAVNPVDGELLWRRGDLESGSGSFADAASGFFGDDRVLVVSHSDRIGHDVYDTLTGLKLRQSRLPITSRTRRRAFGRHLMYVTVEEGGRQRMRVWDPRDDRTVIDEPLKDRIFPYATPDHHLAWIDAAGRLKVHDLIHDTRILELKVLGETDQRISSIKVFRDRDCYYVAMLPAQGAVVPRAGTTPVYFVGDTLLPVTHVHGHLLAIDAGTRTLRWRRGVALRSVVRFRHDHLPAVVLLGRTRDRGRGGRQRMLVELLDSRTGETLLLDEKLPTDRIVLAWYDPYAKRLDLQGLKSRITINFQADENGPRSPRPD